MKRIREFDYCVVNADETHDKTVDSVLAIMEAERCKVGQKRVEL